MYLATLLPALERKFIHCSHVGFVGWLTSHPDHHIQVGEKSTISWWNWELQKIPLKQKTNFSTSDVFCHPGHLRKAKDLLYLRCFWHCFVILLALSTLLCLGERWKWRLTGKVLSLQTCKNQIESSVQCCKMNHSKDAFRDFELGMII